MIQADYKRIAWNLRNALSTSHLHSQAYENGLRHAIECVADALCEDSSNFDYDKFIEECEAPFV